MPTSSPPETLDLGRILEISNLINSSLEIETVLDHAMQGVEELMNAEASSIWGLDEPRGELFFRLARGRQASKVKELRLKMGEGAVGWVAQTGQPLIIADTSQDHRFSQKVDATSGFQTRSILCVPLRHQGHLTGVLQVLNKKAPQGFTEDDLSFLTLLANQIATALENAKAHSRIQHLFQQVVQALSVTAEMRDPYTAGHQYRVTQLACTIAREMGLSEEQVRAIHIAGLLHDIGKIVVPAEILAKPGRLSDLEHALIRTHSAIGCEILKTIDFPWPIADIVRQHHEMLDGSGYPDGLRGDAILLEARIIAVADVVEAISSHRPYRASLGIKTALEEISSKSGSRYDPQVVEVCLRLFQEKGFAFV